MAGRSGPGDAHGGQGTHALWTFLAAISGVNDELERARLTATGLPSLLPCHLSGLALLGEGEGAWRLSLQRGGQPLDVRDVDHMLADMEPLSQEAFRRSGLMTATAGGQRGDCAVPASIEKLGVQCLAIVPLMTLRHRLGIPVRRKNEPRSFRPGGRIYPADAG